MNLYDLTTFECSKLITQRYSTSFTLGIKTLHQSLHFPIYAIYGFVRYADEIVDTFHDYDKKKLLQKFKHETYEALEEKISLNPVLHSFQIIVNQYNIDKALIEAFFKSMEMDLEDQIYDDQKYNEYIYGSAEVIGLMCLHVFCDGDSSRYQALMPPARKLGAAFQKVNFLRDIQSDFKERGRTYFPGVDFTEFDGEAKKRIERDIQQDFDAGYAGILKLPESARRGVYLAYIYYLKLFKKIQNCPASKIAGQRIRIADSKKVLLLAQTYVRYRLNIL